MTDEIKDVAERRQARNEQRLLKQEEGRQAMDEHLASLARERDKTLRLRALRHAALIQGQNEAPAPKIKVVRKRAAKV